MSASNDLLGAVLAKLERHADLCDADRRAFLDLRFVQRSFGAGAYLAREGDQVRDCFAVLSGFAYRHKLVNTGSRQIISVHIAGDLIDIQNALFRKATHNVQMMTPGEIAVVPVSEIQAIAADRPAIQRALWLSTLIDGSIFGEWIANVGRRDARARVSHLLCEFAVRLQAIGMIRNGAYNLPMTQEQIGDATGLTSVHVNRTMHDLRRSGLISSDKRWITIEDWRALAEAGDFTATYLHEEAAAA